MLERLLVAGLTTWRISSLLLYEAGPLDAFLKLRSLAARRAFTAQLFSCMYCISVWVAVLCAVAALTEYWVVMLPFALSAIAIVVDQWSSKPQSE